MNHAMTRIAHKPAIFAAAILLLAAAVGPWPAHAADVSSADLHAIANALTFLDGLPHGGQIMVGVVYASDDTKTQAVQVAAALSAIPGPNQSTFRGEPISVKELGQGGGHLDAALLLPSAVGQSAAVSDAARHRHLLTISTDPSCLESKCCVLMVRASDRVQIVLDTAMANSVGANFSSVFTMIVERR